MFGLLMDNLSTIIVAVVVLGCMLLAARSIHKKHKNGGCCGSCCGCSKDSACHTSHKQKV